MTTEFLLLLLLVGAVASLVIASAAMALRLNTMLHANRRGPRVQRTTFR